VTDREFWLEVSRNIGHIMRGLTGITTVIARRYGLGTRETTPTVERR
jgi:hypothetical protein